MRAHPAPTALLALLIACAALAGCGGSEGGASTAAETKPGKRSGGTGSAEPSSGLPAAAFHPKPHYDSGGGSAQFEVEGGDNSVQEFGEEASAAEFEQAARTLHAFLDARAARNWAAACGYLSQGAAQGLGSAAAGSSCAATLAALTGKTPTATLREAAVADAGSLRTEGDQAFLVYRGAGGTVYAISMAREGGPWRVASLSGVPLS